MKRLLTSTLVLLIAAALWLAAPVGVNAQAAYHITPTGTGDGSSFANAASLNDLQTITQAMNGVGGTVTIYPGKYSNVQAVIAGSGTLASPIIIKGQSSNNATFMADLDFGTKFIFQPGIARVQISDLKFQNCPDFCIATYGTMSDITIKNILASNVNRFYEGGLPGSVMAGNSMVFNNIKIEGYTTSAFRFVGDTTDITMDRIYIRFESTDYNPASPTYGAIEFHDNVANVLIRQTTVVNGVNNIGGASTPNTDGFWAGPNTDNITITDSFAAGYTDAGVDLSSKHATLTRVTSVGNRIDFKLEQSAVNAFTLENVVSLNPSQSHIQATDNDVDTIIATVTNGLFETGPTIADPTAPAGSYVVDSYRCGIVAFTGGIVNHDPARRINDTGCTTTTPKATFTNSELGPAPVLVNMPPVPDTTTVGRNLIGDAGGGGAAAHRIRKPPPNQFFWYVFASIIYIMFIHFAFAMRKQFDLQVIAGFFAFGAIVGWFFGRYDTGFIMAVVLSLLFW